MLQQSIVDEYVLVLHIECMKDTLDAIGFPQYTGTFTLTNVCTRFILWHLILLTVVGTSTIKFDFTCLRQISRVINVPVRPTPALHVGTQADVNLKIILFVALIKRLILA